ncbi:L,D-transpeptidase family protein [Marinobacter lutaoensis]|uniref:L,D-transpeptidase family protein n=1 Tax=Marinobacter lutaoensis TaxID=135739 RepID=UPI0015940E13|nr:L,D-transpeptidase family protein [Marinobacter lutaoensis]NVD34246.1 L,D-transpeptidase family protein [Marinobacter lutaoensis]
MRLSRYLITCLLGALSLLPLTAGAADLLARADMRMPTPDALKPERLDISQVLVRKSERRLYLLAGEDVVRSYRISLGDNPQGHKLYEGDERTPEGDYVLDWRNPHSDFHKSIHISYPSPRDRELAEAWGLDPGGNIMIHGLPNDAGDLAFAYVGLDWTDGCIAVTNEAMDEIWQLVPNGTPIRILP